MPNNIKTVTKLLYAMAIALQYVQSKSPPFFKECRLFKTKWLKNQARISMSCLNNVPFRLENEPDMHPKQPFISSFCW